MATTKKDLGSIPALFPLPVIIVGTYNSTNTAEATIVSYGGLCSPNAIEINLYTNRRAIENIRTHKGFTVALADAQHIQAVDYLGTYTHNNNNNNNNNITDTLSHTGLVSVKSTHVDAPVLTDFSIILECTLTSLTPMGSYVHIVGEIVNVIADEKVLDSKGEIDAKKINVAMFSQFSNEYYALGEKIGDVGKMCASLGK